MATRLEAFINSVKVDDVEDEEERKIETKHVKNKTTPSKLTVYTRIGLINCVLESRKNAAKVLRAPTKIFPESPVKRSNQVNSSSADNTLTLVENTPISKKFNRLPMETMTKLVKKWLFIDDNEDTPLLKSTAIPKNRKRPHKLSTQNSIPIKIQKGENESKSSYYNLSILFSNFQ